MMFNIKLCTVFLNNFLYFCGTNQWRKDLAQISNSYPNGSANMASDHRATITGVFCILYVCSCILPITYLNTCTAFNLE